MLAPDYLDTLPDALVELFQQVEDDILRDIARRINKMGGLTSTAAWQAWRLEQTRAVYSDGNSSVSGGTDGKRMRKSDAFYRMPEPRPWPLMTQSTALWASTLLISAPTRSC